MLKRIIHKYFHIICAVLVALSFVLQAAVVPVLAETEQQTVQYTDVLEDLQKDEMFDVSKYPDIANDYSLQVIHVAESEEGELLIYVYQPSHATKDLTAARIRLGVSKVNADTTYKDYTLKKISENGVFDKYIVENFELPTDNIRIYDVVQIDRAWDKDIDEGTGTDNVINYKAYGVGKRFALYTIDGVTHTELQEIKTITITNLWAGQIRYPDGFYLVSRKYTDSHFLVFTTDMQIDYLMEADITFVSRAETYTYQTDGNGRVLINGSTLGDPVVQPPITIKGEEISHEGGGLFSKEYSWNRIEKASSFLNGNNELLDEDAKGKVQNVIDGSDNTAWVLRFTETSYEKEIIYGVNANGMPTDVGYYIESTNISEVTILRLKFVTDGVAYNLGVVCNTITSDNLSDGGESQWDAGVDELKKLFKDTTKLFIGLLIIVAVVCFCLLLAPFILPLLSSGLKLLWRAIKWAFGLLWKVFWLVIVFPFNLIGLLFKKKDDISTDKK